MDHLYNSLDPACKSPFGAVRAGRRVRFSLTIPSHYGFVEPRLVLTPAGGQPAEHRMQFEGCVEDVNHFSLSLRAPAPGLYFYYFDLYSDFRKLYRGPLGEAVVSWVPAAPWQLTVYEPEFETPAELKGGVLYQIFPDRFCEGVPGKPLPFADRVYREKIGRAHV